MLKTSFVVPSPDRQKQELHHGARGSLRLCDHGMAEWSNNGDPDDLPAALGIPPAMQSRPHLLGLLRSAASGQLTAVPPTSVMNSRRFTARTSRAPGKLLLRSHANAGVSDCDLDPVATVGDPARPQPNLTFLGELAGIAEDDGCLRSHSPYSSQRAAQ